MVLLCLTSFLFTTTIIHAFYAGDLVYHHMMLCVTVLSVAVHTSRHIYPQTALQYSKYIETVCTVDKAVAHLVFCFVLKDMVSLMIYDSVYNIWMLVFPYTILMTWILEHCPQYQHMEQYLHAILHVTSICAVHIVMLVRSQ